MSRFRTYSAAVTLLAFGTACGSTVQVRGTAASGLSGDGQSQPAGTTGGSVSGATGGLVSGSTGSVSGPTGAAVGGSTSGGSRGTVASTTGGTVSGGTTGATGAVGTSGPSGGPSALSPTGRGWDRKYVFFGVVTQKDSQRAFAAFGANVDPGDTEAQANAVANDINAHGGILGRQLKLVFKDVATVNTATNAAQVGNEVCTYFSEDHPVVAVLSIVTVMDYQPFRACLAKHKVPLFSATMKAADKAAADTLAPYFYQAIAVSWDALAPVLVNRLKAQGYFSGWNSRLGQSGTAKTRVGVLVDGSDVGTRLGKLLSRELAKAGYGDTVVFQYQDASQGQSASVQKFSGEGVTHVIVTDVELTAFQTSANSQQYKPRYGISTYNDPYSNLESGGLTPPGANNGAVGVGWAPTFDVSAANDPGATKGGAACLRAMAANHQSFDGKRLAQAFAYSVCDSIYLTAKGAAVARSLTGAGIAQGIQSISSSYSPANGFTAALTSSKHFVPGSVRDLQWYPSCSCFKYGATRTPL
ncbi:MAG: hypothetical protein QOI20_3000 [Acidimicrobiaceae bacterium]|nr:hypothetical protein [Acidimicrobiaceae bacterium]